MSEATTGSESPEIREMLDRVVGSGVEAPEPEPTAPAAEAEAEKPSESEALETRLRELESSIAATNAENQILRDLALRQQAPQPVEQEEEPTLDVAELEKRLRVAPVQTIQEIVNQATARVAKQVREETLAEVRGETRQRDALSEDRERVLTDFPEIMEDATLQQEAGAEFERLKRLHGGQTIPGDMYSAVSAAIARRARGGKPLVSGPVAARTRPGRQIVSPLVAAPPSTAEQDDARPESEFKQHELAAIDKIAKQFGMSREQYFKRFSAARQRDRSFGRV